MSKPAQSKAEILGEYGPFPGIERVGGVTYDGRRVWIAAGDKLAAIDPQTGTIDRSVLPLAGSNASSLSPAAIQTR